MREIKFRAWDCKKRKMYEVSALIFDQCGWEGNKEYGYLPRGCYNGTLLKDSELMQYTGLKDKSGKEIYEGDIVRFYTNSGEGDEPVLGIIYWEQAAVAFWIDWFEGWVSEGKSYDMGKNWDDLEVIGNIYENPDLIGEIDD